MRQKEGAAFQLCLSARWTLVGPLKSINGLNHDETTACVDVPFYPGWLFGGSAGEGGDEDDGGNVSLL